LANSARGANACCRVRNHVRYLGLEAAQKLSTAPEPLGGVGGRVQFHRGVTPAATAGVYQAHRVNTALLAMFVQIPDRRDLSASSGRNRNPVNGHKRGSQRGRPSIRLRNCLETGRATAPPGDVRGRHVPLPAVWSPMTDALAAAHAVAVQTIGSIVRVHLRNHGSTAESAMVTVSGSAFTAA
jgi:hypothetical protein